MNSFKLLFFLGLFLTFSTCGKDKIEEVVCTQSDWVGTYTGTQTCDSDSPSDITLTVTADGTEAIIISYMDSSSSITYDPLTPDGCDLNDSASDLGLSLVVSASLDGDNLELKEVLSDGTQSSTCIITVVRD